MKQLKFLIAEDELVLAHTTVEMLHSIGCKNVVIGHNFAKAKSLIENDGIDIALLDINLGKGEEGISLAAICLERQIPFIYISSYSDRATLDKVIKTQPGAYLNKPITEASLYATLQILVSKYREDQQNDLLIFKDGTETVKLPVKMVRYLKSENIYVNVVTDSKTFLFRGSLAALMSKLPEGMLVQTHRAYVVNPKHIQRVSATHIILNCGVEIPVGRNYKPQLSRL